MDKIVIFSTGMDAAVLMRELEQTKEFFHDEVIGVCDNQKEKWHTSFFGVEVLPPDALSKLEYDYVVIATRDYFYEIKNQLIQQYSLLDSKILTFTQYLQRINIQYQYARNIASENSHIENKFDSDKLVVYTAIQGDYDDLKDPLFTDPHITYVCFTDNKNIKSDIWNIEYTGAVQDSALGIRKYKILPHLFLKDFHTSIWVDGNLLIKKDLRQFIRQYGRESNFLCFPHEQRRCIYDEGSEVIRLRKAQKKEVIQQMAYYLKDLYPEDNGLLWGGFMVRNHNNSEIIQVMEEWWEQINCFTKRDQISLPYVLYKNHCRYDFCDLNLRQNDWININRHKHL